MSWATENHWTLFFTLLTWSPCLKSQETSSSHDVGTSDFWSRADSWAASALSLWGYVESLAEEDCPETFLCEKDIRPRANALYKPSPNGCGSFGYNVDKYVAGGMTKCCNKHDICFATCGTKKSDCDAAFKKCLFDVCRSEVNAVQNDKVCRISAKLLYGATTLAGCSSFREAQVAACLCDSRSYSKSRREEL